MTRTPAAEAPAIAADHLGVSLGGPPVLHDVSFTIDPGESVGLFGGNGSGKTTLLRTLLGLVPPQRGESRLFGTPVRRYADWARIGYVPQRSTVPLEGATLVEVVASGRLARRRPFTWASRADRAATAHAIAQVELTDLRDLPFTALSGGQQQRALIARALAGEPDLLCLDEPLTGIDLPSQQQLAATLGALRDNGHTLLVVLHEAGPLRPVLGRRLVLQDGHLTHDERD